MAAHWDYWMPRDGPVSFPKNSRYNWRDLGYLRFVCEREGDQEPAPFPSDTIATILRYSRASFDEVEATGAQGDLIREYFGRIDPDLYGLDSDRQDGHDMIVFPDGDGIGVLFGDFGMEMDPEYSRVDMLSSDSFATYDTVKREWANVVDEKDFTEDHVGIWAAPCLGVPA